METPAIQLGVDNEVLDQARSLSLFEDVREDRRSGRKPADTAWLMCTVSHDLCTGYYLRGEFNEARCWAVEAVNAVEYLLFGDWREKEVTDEGTIDPVWWFSHETGWTLEVAGGLCWGAVFGLWDSIDKIMAFPTEKIGKDLEGPVPRAFYVGLAKWWADRAELSWVADVKSMRGAGSKDYHLRCDVLQAISSGDSSLASKAFTKYLQFWVKQIKDCPQRLADAAAFLWHVAKRDGIVIELPDDLSIHVVSIPDGE